MAASPPQNSNQSPAHEGPTPHRAATAGPDDAEPGGRPAVTRAHLADSVRPSAPAGPSPGCQITLNLETLDADPPIMGWVDTLLAQIARCAGVTDGQINLLIVTDARMADFHQQYCNIPGTTDVLTFDMRDDTDAAATFVEGDVVICIDEAARQAAKRHHPVRMEALLYAVHGLLHLLGEDDHDDDAYQRMHQREDELLTAVGVGAVFTKPRNVKSCPG